jgi:hypothetical protein
MMDTQASASLAVLEARILAGMGRIYRCRVVTELLWFSSVATGTLRV